ncbi:DMT family transporter [Oligoflexia bacterium]|nr:DMT family transporter [Oligoflexia bacterium]
MRKEREGEIFVTLEAIFWGLFPVITILSVNTLPPLFCAGVSTLVAALFFAVVLTIKKEWHQLKVTAAWKNILLATFYIGFLFYGLLFWGISLTTAGNASIILLMEVFFSVVVLRAWGKERLTAQELKGATLMVVGAAIVLFPGKIELRLGDLIVLLAPVFTPFGNYYTQKARREVSSSLIMFVRSLISGLALLLIAFVIGGLPERGAVVESGMFLLINGVLILGLSKLFWIEAIHRISISKAISMASISPLFALIFAYFFLAEIPTAWQICGLLPVLVGVWLLAASKKMV